MEEIAHGLIIRNGKYLAVKEDKDWYWKLPGGGLEEKETPVEALIRELGEELGITKVNILRKIHVFDLNFKGRNFRFHSYLLDIFEEPNNNEDDLIFEWQNLERMIDAKDQAPSQRILYQRLIELGLNS